MTELEQGEGDRHVQSLERGLAVLRCFDRDHPRLTLSEVAVAAGMSRAAARRFLLTLVDLRYLTQEGRYFSLTPRVLSLGYSYLGQQTLPRIAEPHVQRLAAQLGESTSIAVLDDDEIVFVACILGRDQPVLDIAVGAHYPAYATAAGRVLIAGLPPAQRADYLASAHLAPLTEFTVGNRHVLRAEVNQVLEQGWSAVSNELQLGLRAVAVPLSERRRVVAALSVSLHVSDYTPDDVRYTVVPVLRAAARAIENDLTQG